MAEALTPFRQAGIVRGRRVMAQKVAGVSFSRLLKAIEASASATATIDPSHLTGHHVIVPSIALGGGTDECGGLGCRERKVDELVRFVALYADRAILRNFVANYAPGFGHPPDADSPSFRHQVYVDLRVMLAIEPLLNAGLVDLIAFPGRYCPECISEAAFGPDSHAHVQAALRYLESQFLENSTAAALVRDGKLYIRISSATPLLEHGALICPARGRAATQIRRLLSGERPSDPVPLPRALAETLGLYRDLAAGVVRRLVYQTAVSQTLGGTFVTERDLDVEVLRDISDAAPMRLSSITPAAIRTMVPYIPAVPVSTLLRLRRTEEDAFLRFRGAIDRAVKEISCTSNPLTADQARDIAGTIMEPGVAKVNQAVRRARRRLTLEVVGSSAGAVAAFCVGTYAGVLPDSLAAAARALGVTKMVYDTIRAAVAAADITSLAAKNPLYYLWKVQQSAVITRACSGRARARR